MHRWVLLGVLLWPGVAIGAEAQATSPVRIFAAASLGPVLEQIIQDAGPTAPRVELNTAGSSTLAKQMLAGAPFDLYLSANGSWMDQVQQAGLIDADTRVDLLGGELVVATLRTSEASPALDIPLLQYGAKLDLLPPGRIALGDPTHVPAGIYALQAFTALGWAEALQPRLTPMLDVRAAAAVAESGEAGCAVVYRSDVATNPRLRVRYRLDPALHEPIRYVMACSVQPTAAGRAWHMLLQSDRARDRFIPAGFVPLFKPIPLSSGVAEPPVVASSTAVWSAVALSLRVAAVGTLLALLPGIALGWLLARKQFPGRILLDAIVHLPLVLPPVVVGYVLLLALGRGSALGRLLHDTLGVELLFTWKAAALACGLMGFPLLVRAVRLAVEAIDPKLEQAGAVLGLSPLTILWRITLPLARPGIVAGALLCFVRSMGEFGATILVAGNIADQTRTIPLAIFTDLQRPEATGLAWKLALLSVALSILALAIGERLQRRPPREATS